MKTGIEQAKNGIDNIKSGIGKTLHNDIPKRKLSNAKYHTKPITDYDNDKE